ncbi:MAG: 4'-phosphopantetheinyl transferase superfamily protein [Bryobacteraceae bacterium]|nr:4'-phosphopantetheinyl transferase superfamily protein [Bryobacteraceae bacterium]
MLDQEELGRASRYHFERDRRAFVLTRSILRLLAGQYTGRDPRDIRFATAAHGKLSLDPAEGIFFNVSHSSGQSLIAFARCEVGVDVEGSRPASDYLDIAEQFFADSEVRWLRALPPGPALQDGFLRLWTVKEAWLKATGQGLAIPLAAVRVEFAGMDRVRMEFPAGYRGRWTVWELPRDKNCYAAIALEAETIRGIRLIQIRNQTQPPSAPGS